MPPGRRSIRCAEAERPAGGDMEGRRQRFCLSRSAPAEVGSVRVSRRTFEREMKPTYEHRRRGCQNVIHRSPASASSAPLSPRDRRGGGADAANHGREVMSMTFNVEFGKVTYERGAPKNLPRWIGAVRADARRSTAPSGRCARRKKTPRRRCCALPKSPTPRKSHATVSTTNAAGVRPGGARNCSETRLAHIRGLEHMTGEANRHG
jgi:hypothetical protein